MPGTLDPITPGEILLEEFMKPLDLSQNRLARELDVPAGRIHGIIHGKRAITPDTALRLARYFGVSAEFWVNLQARHDLKVARNAVGPMVERRVRARRTSDGAPTGETKPRRRPARAG
ncbi:MAG TPA: HigA family addiction module antitoxin [Candidatus Binataceae bacterium]|nr:HigA family addiction module antitoxin [Candidatus Binataceae bacterium]